MTLALHHLLPVIIAWLALVETVPDDSPEGSPIVFLLMLVFLIVVLILVGIGIGLALAAVACAACLAALGIVSTATLIAAWRQRVSSGLRALHYQACAAVGLPVGIAIALAVSSLVNPALRLRWLVLSGAAGGVAAGLLLALLSDLAARLVYRRVMLAVETRRERGLTLLPALFGSPPPAARTTRLPAPPDSGAG